MPGNNSEIIHESSLHSVHNLVQLPLFFKQFYLQKDKGTYIMNTCFLILLFVVTSFFHNAVATDSSDTAQEQSSASNNETAIQEKPRDEYEEWAYQFSRTLTLTHDGKTLDDQELLAKWQDIFFKILTFDATWIDAMDIKEAYNIAQSFFKDEFYKTETAYPLLCLAFVFATKGLLIEKALPFCIKGLDHEQKNCRFTAQNLCDLFILFNIQIETFATSVREWLKNDCYYSRKKALRIYQHLGLYDAYLDDALKAATQSIESTNEKIRNLALDILFVIFNNKNVSVQDSLSSLKQKIFKDLKNLYAAKGLYLDECFEQAQKRIESTLEFNTLYQEDFLELSTLVFLLLHNYNSDDVKRLAQSFLTKKNTIVLFPGSGSTTLEGIAQAAYCFALERIICHEIVANHDVKKWLSDPRRQNFFWLSLKDHINAKNWFRQFFGQIAQIVTQELSWLDGTFKTEEDPELEPVDIKTLINQLKDACVKAGFDQDLVKDLFTRFPALK